MSRTPRMVSRSSTLPVVLALMLSPHGLTVGGDIRGDLPQPAVRAWASGCLLGKPPALAPADRAACPGITVLASESAIVYRHLSAMVNCCTDTSVTVALDGRTVRFQEHERGEPCFCTCSSELGAEIAGLAPGRYAVEARDPSGALLCATSVTVGARPTRLSFSSSGCRPETHAEPALADGIDLATRGSSVFITHAGVSVSCCHDIDVILLEQPGRLEVREIDHSPPSPCQCRTDIAAAITGLAPGGYTLDVFGFDGATAASAKVVITAPPPTVSPARRPLRRHLLGVVPPEPVRFERSGQILPPRHTFAAGIADLDDDGHPDALFANMGDNDSEVWLNDGGGTLLRTGPALTRQAHDVAVGDLDDDGDVDAFVVCAGFQSTPGEPMRFRPSVVYLNDGDGTLQPSTQLFDDAERSGSSVHLLEADGDGDLDALVHYYYGADAIFLNDGHGRFTAAGTVPPKSCAPVDGDGDGRDDLLCTEAGAGYRLLHNEPDGTFTTSWMMTGTPGLGLSTAASDFDGDGLVDVLVATGDSSNRAAALLLVNDGSGGFRAGGQKLRTTAWSAIAVGDLNGDGSIDAVLTNFDQPTEIWLNDGRGLFVDSGVRLPAEAPTMGVAVADLDGDNQLDLVVSVMSPANNLIWFNRTGETAGPGAGGG